MTEITARPGADPRAAPDAPPRPRLLIERWLPIAEIGVESRRENSTGLHPAPNRLHVWWARRPLVVSRAAVLGSLLPAWQADWPPSLRQRFPTEESYHAWFLRLLGIQGDPVAANKIVQWARQAGTRVPNPFTFPRAFSVNPGAEDLGLLAAVLDVTWDSRQILVLDPTAGGGSIPLEALRVSACRLLRTSSTPWPPSSLQRPLTTRPGLGRISSQRCAGGGRS